MQFTRFRAFSHNIPRSLNSAATNGTTARAIHTFSRIFTQHSLVFPTTIFKYWGGKRHNRTCNSRFFTHFHTIVPGFFPTTIFKFCGGKRHNRTCNSHVFAHFRTTFPGFFPQPLFWRKNEVRKEQQQPFLKIPMQFFPAAMQNHGTECHKPPSPQNLDGQNRQSPIASDFGSRTQIAALFAVLLYRNV